MQQSDFKDMQTLLSESVRRPALKIKNPSASLKHLCSESPQLHPLFWKFPIHITMRLQYTLLSTLREEDVLV